VNGILGIIFTTPNKKLTFRDMNLPLFKGGNMKGENLLKDELETGGLEL
jgi:hypothetical protein